MAESASTDSIHVGQHHQQGNIRVNSGIVIGYWYPVTYIPACV